MSPQRVSLSRRDAEALLDLVEGRIGVQMFRESAAVGRLRSALKPSPKRAAAKKERRVEKAGKRATKRERRGDIRAACIERAGGRCECGCGCVTIEGTLSASPHWDHFFGRARAESVETTWILRADCDHERTHNRPDRATWLRKFIAHAERHGYTAAASRARRDLSTAQAKEALSNV